MAWALLGWQHEHPNGLEELARDALKHRQRSN
jgi:hypothetical protein